MSSFSVKGQTVRKRGFPTLPCDAPGGRWRCDAATLLSRSNSATLLTLRCCWRCDAATLRRCDTGATLRRCGAATLRRCDAATLRRGIHAAMLLAQRRCDTAMLRRGSDAATLLALRNSSTKLFQGLNDVPLLSCQLGMSILHVVIASF